MIGVVFDICGILHNRNADVGSLFVDLQYRPSPIEPQEVQDLFLEGGKTKDLIKLARYLDKLMTPEKLREAGL